MTEEIYKIGGMHCAACAASVEKVVSRLPGVESVQVNLMTEKMSVRYDSSQTKPENIIAKVEKAGFTAEPYREGEGAKTEKNTHPGRQLAKIIIMAVLALMCFCASVKYKYDLGFNYVYFGLSPYFTAALYEFLLCLTVLLLGYKFFTKGYAALFRGHPDMNSLVALSATVSLVYSIYQICVAFPNSLIQFGINWVKPDVSFSSAAMVVAFVSVGKYIEDRCKHKTGEALRRLTELAPATAFRVNPDSGVIEEIPAAQLYEGDTVLVRAGDRIPADATVIKGNGCADESMLTGESLPVDKKQGDRLCAGTVLTDGAVYASVAAVGPGTVLAGIVRSVEEAQQKKAPVSRLADRIAGIFVPAVLAIAAVTLIGWFLYCKDFSKAINCAVAVLSVACPCAMGLATPTAIMAGTGLGARHGILVRSGEALETLSRINTVVLDKTGTVTEGVPEVTQINISSDFSENDILAFTAALEKNSSHPLAGAICRKATELGLTAADTTDFENRPGEGLAGTVDGRRILVGKASFTGSCASDCGAGTCVYVSVDGKAAGEIVLTDRLKPEAQYVVEKLKASGYRTVLLSGDSEAAVKSVAEKLGFDAYYAGVLPAEKAAVIEKLKTEGHKVMMVGDGINDAPALTAADSGLAVGNGTDIAMDSADAVLLRRDINGVYEALKLGKLTLHKIKLNLVWAFAYNIAMIPLAAFGRFEGYLGGIFMSISSIFVVTNAILLTKKKLD